MTTTRSSSNHSFAACLAEILKAPMDDVPSIADGLGLAQIGWWLGSKNLALIPVHQPDVFQWAGWWIARLEGGDGYVVMAGTPSGVAWTPPGVQSGAGAVIEGWVIAPPALSLPARNALQGKVAEIYRFPASGAPGEALSSATVTAGVGIEGDRYALGTGHFQGEGRWGQALTIIEAEAIETLAADHGITIKAVEARRNIVSRGIDLNALLGKQFRVSGLLCYASRLAEPCSWLQKTTPPGTLRGLVHRGGLRADILESGTIRTGDAITAE